MFQFTQNNLLDNIMGTIISELIQYLFRSNIYCASEWLWSTCMEYISKQKDKGLCN